jgi:hypothetical protein
MKSVKHCLCENKATKNVWVMAKVFTEWLLCLERKTARENKHFVAPPVFSI